MTCRWRPLATRLHGNGGWDDEHTQQEGQPGSEGRQQAGGSAAELSRVNFGAAGVDVGAGSHFAAVPENSCEQPVREFGAFTADLYLMADWLAECGVETVAMESTGVYWIPLFGVLEERGFQVMLVDPRRIKNVPGRKSDVLDCQCSSSYIPTACFRRLSGPRPASGG